MGSQTSVLHNARDLI